MSKEIIVKEAMKTNLAIVKPELFILESAKIMKKRKIGNVLVTKDDLLVGILTESDIIKKVVAEGKNLKMLV